jgi:hypothetical protein
MDQDNVVRNESEDNGGRVRDRRSYAESQAQPAVPRLATHRLLNSRVTSAGVVAEDPSDYDHVVNGSEPVAAMRATRPEPARRGALLLVSPSLYCLSLRVGQQWKLVGIQKCLST